MRRPDRARPPAVRVAVPLLLAAALLSAVPARAQPAGAGGRLVAEGAWVYDRKTDLTWQRCTWGQTWDPRGRCLGEPQRLGFDDALRLQADGWRVPTLDELVSIVVAGRKPAIDAAAFPDTPPAYFWATDNRDLSAAWYVFFENGKTNHYFPPHTNRDLLRLVRSGRYMPPAPSFGEGQR